MGFLFLLTCLGVMAIKAGPSPAYAAGAERWTSPLDRLRMAPEKKKRIGRQFMVMEGAQVQLAPQRLTGSERYDYYAALASHHSGQEPTRTTVLGLRGLAPDGSRHSSGDNMSDYDDTFVILRPSVRKSRELLGSTHAGQATSTLSPPEGVAQIQPGVYWAEPCGDFNGMAAWWLTTGWGNGRIPCWRDGNGDGFISQAEKGKPMIATEILFHNGRNDTYGTSVGCQVLSPKRMKAFIETVGEGVAFDYVLVDANRPIGKPLTFR